MSVSTMQNAPAELQELRKFAEGATLSSKERDQLQQIVERLEIRVRNRNLTLHVIKDALSALNFNCKHILFDLYATRCERDNYKSKLQDAGIDC